MAAARNLGELIEGHGLAEDSEPALCLHRYLALLEKWNARINLTASTAWAAIGWLFEEALWAVRFYPESEVRHLDIGSGAGFPAIPMRILIPGMDLHLVESRAKRVAFLETVAAELKLDGVKVFRGRIEEYLGAPSAAGYDVVSWKGMKLSDEALRLLLKRSLPSTKLWLFHGKELPFADPQKAKRRLSLMEKREFPARTGHNLSIYGVSRGTCFT